MKLSVDFCPREAAGGRHSPEVLLVLLQSEPVCLVPLIHTQHTEHTSCLQCPVARGWGSSNLRLAFYSVERDVQRCPQIPGFLSLMALSLVCPEPCCVIQNHQPHLFLSFSRQTCWPLLGIRDPHLQDRVSCDLLCDFD